ncbi:MAG TPA: hypothetical protein VG755_32005 [Nannocystaceae bacterium]|nr:hypothetical protein [Nannocystaceae bacterium]
MKFPQLGSRPDSELLELSSLELLSLELSWVIVVAVELLLASLELSSLELDPSLGSTPLLSTAVLACVLPLVSPAPLELPSASLEPPLVVATTSLQPEPANNTTNPIRS